MSEELYNSSDYCSLAEQYEELKKENANMEIESLTQKCKALEADYEVSNREMLIIQVEIGRLKSELARRDEIITRLKEDAIRLADGLDTYWQSIPEGQSAITLHRALMKELAEC